MGRHSLEQDDEEEPQWPTEDPDEEPSRHRTMERDYGGVQGFEYFGVDTREEDK